MGAALNLLAHVAVSKEDYVEAERRYRQGVELYRDSGNVGGYATALVGVELAQPLERDTLVWHFPHYRHRPGPYSIIRRGPWKLIHFWEGQDELAGVNQFDIYVSTNGGPFELWLDGTEERSGTFHGAHGNLYAFYSVGIDRCQNRENAHKEAEARTKIPPPPTEQR